LHGGERSVAEKDDAANAVAPATAGEASTASSAAPATTREGSTPSSTAPATACISSPAGVGPPAAAREASAASGEARSTSGAVAANPRDIALPFAAHGATVVTVLCENCGAPVNGKYCASCGQRHDPHIHSLGEFITEATESITHADSRVWRTLWALMIKPGFLTKEFLEGRRARYLPPFRLYLVLSVAFFLIAAAGGHDSVRFVSLGTGEGQSSLEVRKLEDMPAKPTETPEQRATRICKDLNFIVGSNEGLVDGPAVCRKIVGDNGRALAQALYHNIPHALIILLPLLALTMRLMYLRRHYVEHLLFFVHTHAFAFVFLALYVLVMRFVPYESVQDTATLGMLLGLPYYTYRAMLRVYGQGKWVTRAKFSLLSLSYFVLGVIMTVLLGLYTAVTL
jgi:hypothetical protein